MSVMRATAVLLRMVKIEHSVFALPFAYMGLFLAAQRLSEAGAEASLWPGWRPFLLLTVAMVAVRSFAMAFNRLADIKYDSLNPRTQGRPLVTGEITPGQTRLFLLVTAAIFLVACAGLNPLCLELAPFALLLSALYSYAKRFTWLCHFVLGAVLGLSPLAGWLSVDPQFTLPAVLFLMGVLFWVAGFDILYSCQDVAFDQGQGLHSVPARFGVPGSLIISSFCHVNTSVLFLLAGWAAGLGAIYYAVWAGISAVLAWEHTLIKADDLSRVNLAFFTLNGFISVALFAGVLADLML